MRIQSVTPYSIQIIKNNFTDLVLCPILNNFKGVNKNSVYYSQSASVLFTVKQYSLSGIREKYRAEAEGSIMVVFTIELA